MTPPAALARRLREAGCVFAEDEAGLLLAAADDVAALERMVEQRAAGRPLEQILGWAEFRGLRVRVEPGVFVPRRRSSLLVALAARRLAPGDVVVDVCCGSGALGLALAAAVPGLRVYAVDNDPAAVRCARRNLDVVGGTVLQGSLLGPLPTSLRGQVSAVVAVPPYVPSAEIALMPAEARDHEPRAALDGGVDGLDVMRALAAEVGPWLAADGHVLVEVAAHQAQAVAAQLGAVGLGAGVESDDESGATAVVARRR
nr:putative protein N(5)-glutamine methyltransferase [Motilibacter aurantiacus]